MTQGASSEWQSCGCSSELCTSEQAGRGPRRLTGHLMGQAAGWGPRTLQGHWSAQQWMPCDFCFLREARNLDFECPFLVPSSNLRKKTAMKADTALRTPNSHADCAQALGPGCGAVGGEEAGLCPICHWRRELVRVSPPPEASFVLWRGLAIMGFQRDHMSHH